MKLIHYNSKPDAITMFSQPQSHGMDSAGPFGKPKGLWISVEGDDDWREWCEAEGFNIDSLACEHEVTLTDDHNVLVLSSPAALDDFTERYGAPWDINYERIGIKWHEVAADYDGIIIAPYVWERRMSDHTSWYYGWDCASGCIWNERAVQGIVLRETSDEQDKSEGDDAGRKEATADYDY